MVCAYVEDFQCRLQEDAFVSSIAFVFKPDVMHTAGKRKIHKMPREKEIVLWQEPAYMLALWACIMRQCDRQTQKVEDFSIANVQLPKSCDAGDSPE